MPEEEYDICYVAGAGPSLALAPTSLFPVITTNNAYKHFSSIVAQFAYDSIWWIREGTAFRSKFPNVQAYSAAFNAEALSCFNNWNVRILNQTRTGNDERGFEIKPMELRGTNSGMLAVNLAYHLGYRNVVLIGFDMRTVGSRAHFDETQLSDRRLRSYQRTFNTQYRDDMDSAYLPGLAAGMVVLNATPDSALRAYPKVPLSEVLQRKH